MARARKTTDAIISDYPHPRTRAELFGHMQAEQTFLQAYKTGRLHHAWLICGPEGIGKASFAYRLARFLLSYPHPATEGVQNAQDLHISEDTKMFHEVAHNTQPDCHHVELEQEKGKPKKSISVDAIRDMTQAMLNTSGTGGWRVAIIDSADDLNINGANALLKVLEEPPPKCLFLLVSHQPAQLLPTLRSRCQKIQLTPLSHQDMMKAAQSVDSGFQCDQQQLRHANGSVRALLNSVNNAENDMRAGLQDILGSLPGYNAKNVQSLSESIARKTDIAFDDAVSTVLDYCHKSAVADLAHGADYADFAADLQSSARNLQIYNLDKKSFILTQIAKLARLVSRKSAA